VIETLTLTALLAAAMLLVRSHWRVVSGAWRGAHWWERALLCAALAPIPGPVDELVGVLVVRRVVRRIGEV
jgi:hypothetical protein